MFGKGASDLSGSRKCDQVATGWSQQVLKATSPTIKYWQAACPFDQINDHGPSFKFQVSSSKIQVLRFKF